MIWSMLLLEILSMETSVCERPRFSSVPRDCVRLRCSSLVCARLREPSKDVMLELEVVRDRSLVMLAADTGERGEPLMVYIVYCGFYGVLYLIHPTVNLFTVNAFIISVLNIHVRLL